MNKKLQTTLVLIFLLIITGCYSNAKQEKIEFLVQALEFTNTDDEITILYIAPPLQEKISFKLELNARNMYQLESEIYEGWIVMIDSSDEFNLEENLPNHSVTIEDESITIPFGECRIITLDSDNGTAASGVIGTHKSYYAQIKNIQNESYLFSFTGNNNEDQTKVLLIDILETFEVKTD